MPKRTLAVSFTGDSALPVKHAKLSENLPVQESDTMIESISLPHNYIVPDSGNEFSGESENEGDVLSTHGDAKKKRKCKSKNAVMARINRIKKKRYIEGLELRTSQLEVENKSLQDDLNQKVDEITALKREVLHLKNVIRNRTEIGTLLKCIHQNTNLKITSSILGNSAQNSSAVSRHNVSMKEEPKDILESPSTNVPTLSNSDEEGKTLVYNNHNHSYSLLNGNPIVASAFLSPKEILDEFNFDHDVQSDHDYFVDLETKVSRFEIPSPDCILRQFDSEQDVFERCETPTKGTNSGAGSSYFADEDLSFNHGICLHVANNQVSIEFCDTCNHKALQSS